MRTVKIGNRLVGPGQPCYIVAEIGINHNGDIHLAKRIGSIAVAPVATCDGSEVADSNWQFAPMNCSLKQLKRELWQI